LVIAAIVASHVGAIVWHRQSPATPEQSVKLGLGVMLSVTAVAFALIFQAASGRLVYPEVIVPIAAIGRFLFPCSGRPGLEAAVQGQAVRGPRRRATRRSLSPLERREERNLAELPLSQREPGANFT
jgi:hypothetical protein